MKVSWILIVLFLPNSSGEVDMKKISVKFATEESCLQVIKIIKDKSKVRYHKEVCIKIVEK